MNYEVPWSVGHWWLLVRGDDEVWRCERQVVYWWGVSDEVWSGDRQVGYWWGWEMRCGVVTARLVISEGWGVECWPPGWLLVSGEVWSGDRQVGYWWGWVMRCGVATARLVTGEWWGVEWWPPGWLPMRVEWWGVERLPPGCLLVRMSDEVWHGYRQVGYWWGLSDEVWSGYRQVAYLWGLSDEVWSCYRQVGYWWGGGGGPPMWSLVRDEWWVAWWPSSWSPETICGVTVHSMVVPLVFPSVTQIFLCLRRPPLWDRTLGRRDPVPKSLTEGMTERSRVAVGTDSSWSRASVRRVASTACPVHVYPCRTGEACRKHSVPGARVPVSQDRWAIAVECCGCTCGELCSGKHGWHWPTMLSALWGKESI